MDQYLKPNSSLIRLIEEYNQYGSLVIAYDFDNTIFDFHNKGETYELMINLLKDLKKIGCYLICFTANQDTKSIASFLDKKNIPYDAINKNPPFFKSKARKIYFNAYLDDRAGLYQVYSELKLLVHIVQESIQNKTICKQQN